MTKFDSSKLREFPNDNSEFETALAFYWRSDTYNPYRLYVHPKISLPVSVRP